MESLDQLRGEENHDEPSDWALRGGGGNFGWSPASSSGSIPSDPIS